MGANRAFGIVQMTVNSRLSATAERKETDAIHEQTEVGCLGNNATLHLYIYYKGGGLDRLHRPHHYEIQ